MPLELNSQDEWRALMLGLAKSLAKRAPGMAEILGSYDEFRRQRREKALQQFLQDIVRRLERLDSFDEEWIRTEEGQVFAGKVAEAALDLQMADKRELFANALINGATSDLPFAARLKFVDLLRGLSRLALDVLAELHRQFGPIVANSASGQSTQVQPQRVVEELCGSSDVEPYAVYAAVEELRSAGLFSNVLQWRRHADGKVRDISSVPVGHFAYTTFTAAFVEFVTDAESDRT